MSQLKALKAWGDLALYVLAPFSEIKDITVPNYDKGDLMDMLNIIKRDINEHELLNFKHTKVTELSLLKSRIINEYQRYLVCLDTHDYKLKEVVKNEIFKLLDERQKLEKKLGEMK